jgi:zinc protease
MTVATRPLPSTAREYHFPAFYRRQLSNGMQLVVAPIHKLPLVTVLAVVSDAGATAETAEKEGVASLTARALTEGAGVLDGEALTDQLEQLGTSIDTDADWDAAMVKMTVLPHKLETAFARFADVLSAPTFPASAIERLKGERIAEIMQIESEPREYANEQFRRFVYTARSRFGIPVGGPKSSVTSLTRQDIVDFYLARYRPKGVTLIVVGDITVDAAEAMAERALGHWTGDKPNGSKVDDSPARLTRQLHIVPKNDAPQSELRIGHVGVPRNNPDYFNITVMNAILGGLFGSRVNLNLREAHGYTYGASSAFDWRRAAGPFVISTAVASNVTVEAIKETLYEVDRMRSDVVTEEELTLATNYLNGVFPIRYETTSSVASALAALVIYELTDDWYDTYRANISSVTPQHVLEAAQKYINPDALQIVIVGDASTIQAPLESAGFAPVTVYQ